jgi:hypothetical protein
VIKQKNTTLIHVLASFGFLFLAFLFSPDWPNIGRMLDHPVGLGEFIFQVEMLAFFYLNYYLLIDKFYFPKKHLQYFGILILAIIICYLVDALIMHFKVSPPEILKQINANPLKRHRPRLFIILLNKKLHIFLLVVVVSLLLKIRQRFKIIQQENIMNELSFLKAQINPHFLFNTLNSIYSLSLQKSDETSTAIVKLSEMMRYVLKDTKGKVSLTDDLNYLNDYLELQKLRLTQNVILQLEMKGDFSAWRIEPLLIIPFIENAFKYGVSVEESAYIFILIEVNELGILHVVTKNKKTEAVPQAKDLSKVGLINVKKRLHLLYPDKHKLYVNDLTKEFGIDLTIALHD